MSRRLEFYYEVLLKFDKSVSNHSFVLRTIPHSFDGQQVENADLELSPAVSCNTQYDSFGNLLKAGRIDEPHSHFHYKVHGEVLTDQSKPLYANKGGFSPIWRLPTRYTAISEKMQDCLDGLVLPERKKDRAWILCEYLYKHMKYIPGTTGVSTKASEAFSSGCGVCQDFAHVYLAFARKAGLPARYCNGLTEGEGASHAWCEVLLDDCWIGIDPTRGKWTDESYLRFNIGRDFADCPMERGVFNGDAMQTQSVLMKVW